MAIPLTIATQEAQESEGRSPKFSVYFDWKFDNFTTGIRNFDHWMQCVEEVGNEYLPLEDLDGNTAITPAFEDAYIVYANPNNVGNASIDETGLHKCKYNYPGEGEIFDIIAQDNEVDGVCNFVVKSRTKNIGVLEDAEIDELYDENGYIDFKISSGSQAVAIEDRFTIYPALTTQQNDIETTITNSLGDNDSSFIVDGGPDFIYWDKVEWLSEGNVRVYIRTASDLDNPFWSKWYEYTSGDQLNSEQARRYLQFKVVLNSTASLRAKIAYLHFSYKVKAHTNNVVSDQYTPDFNDIISIRISRSKEFITAGYGAADCNLVLSNTHMKYSKENISSPYYGYVKPNLRFIVELGFEEQTIKKIEAFATEFSIDAAGCTFNIRGQDYAKMFLAKQITNEDISSRVFIDKPIGFLVKMVALDTGYPIERVKVSDISVDDNVPYAYFKDKQAWKELQDLVLAYELEIYIDESGDLILRDRWKKKNIYRSPRYSTRNVVTSICKNESNGDIFMVVNSEENEDTFLYLYNSEYVNIDTDFKHILYCAESQDGDFSSTVGIKSDKIIRIAGDEEIPTLETVVEMSTSEFMNEFLYCKYAINNNKYLYGVLKDDNGDYYYYKYRYLDQNNSVVYPTDNKYTYFLSGFDANYIASLSTPANSTRESDLYYINPVTGADGLLRYNQDWRFTDSTLSAVQILRNYDSSLVYSLRYVPQNVVQTIGASIEYIDQFDLGLENFSEITLPRMIINDLYNQNGRVFFVRIVNGNTITVTDGINTGEIYTYAGTDVAKYLGGACDVSAGKLYLFVETPGGSKKVLSLDLTALNPAITNIIDTGDVIQVDGIEDTTLHVYDVAYNEEDEYIYLGCGYTSNSENKYGLFYRYKEQHIRIEWENSVGKPLSNAIARLPFDPDSVIEKNYNIYFQKRGGFEAVTSQIWAWYGYTRNNEDKLKCAIQEEQIIADAVDVDVNGKAKKFQIPSSSSFEFSEIEYVYRSDTVRGWINIANNWYKDNVNEQIILFDEVNTNTTQIKFGQAKILKKYFGEYFRIDGTTNPDWSSLSLVVTPYKPSKLRFRATNINSGNIYVSGRTLNNTVVNETLAYSSGDEYVEGTNIYRQGIYGEVVIDASELLQNGTSTLICESTYDDLIPGVDLHIYANPDEPDEQFGGNGLVSSFTNEASVDVIIEGGALLTSRITDEKAITALSVTSNGYTYGGTSYTGRFFIYTKSDVEQDIYDFVLRYNSNITKLDYQWGSNDIKNAITITAKTHEVTPEREYDIETGIWVNDIPNDSIVKDWSKLEILYKTESPALLAPGKYLENNVNFSNPVYAVADNVLRFNAHVSEFAGYLRSNDITDMYYLDWQYADFSGSTFAGQEFIDSVNYKLTDNFISVEGSGGFVDPYTGESYTLNVFEAEKRNMEIYVGNIKLSYPDNEYDISVNTSGTILTINMLDVSGDTQGLFIDAPVTVHYPMRWNVREDVLVRNIDMSNDTGEDEDYLWSYVFDTHYDNIPDIGSSDNRLKYYYVDKGGFQLNVLWPNRSSYAETSYLRVENSASDSLDAYYDPQANPSGWTVWIDKIEIRGLPVVEAPITVALEKDLQSIDEYFEQTYSLDNAYIQTAEVGTRLAKYILKNHSQPIIKPSTSILGKVSIQLGDLVAIYDVNTAIEGDIFEVIGIDDNISVGSAYLNDLTLQKTRDQSTGQALYNNNSAYDSGYRYH